MAYAMLPAGFWASLPLVDMPPYLDYLAGRLVAAGGRIELRAVASLAELAAEAPLIVNCAGLGAGALSGDESVTPVRGQHVIVDNPGLEEFFVEAPFKVGLRPTRPTVRLEVEQIGAARCVHNYGHGGSGVTHSWGSAFAAAALLLDE